MYETFATGPGLYSVVAADINGDGKPDLVTGSISGSTISVLLNTAAPITLQDSPATGTISSAQEAPVTIAPVEGSTPQAAEVGTGFAVPLAVEVRDAAGNLAQGVRVTFKAPRRGPSGNFDGSTSVTVVTDVNGRATAPEFVANTVAGDYAVTAHAAGGSRPAADFSLSNTPAPAVAFQVLAPAAADPGLPFDVTVVAVDPYGNIDTNYTGTIHFDTSDGDPGVVLPDDYTFQPGDAGQVIFAGGVTLVTPGDQMLTVMDTESGISGSATVSVSDGAGPPRPLGRESGAAPEQASQRRRGSEIGTALAEAAGLSRRRAAIRDGRAKLPAEPAPAENPGTPAYGLPHLGDNDS
jgi:hypothetical protein